MVLADPKGNYNIIKFLGNSMHVFNIASMVAVILASVARPRYDVDISESASDLDNERVSAQPSDAQEGSKLGRKRAAAKSVEVETAAMHHFARCRQKQQRRATTETDLLASFLGAVSPPRQELPPSPPRTRMARMLRAFERHAGLNHSPA